jgi:hypothetical protein
MRSIWAILVVLALIPLGGSASAATAGATDCNVPLALPSPPAGRPAYTLRVAVAKGLKVASGTLSVAFRPEVATNRIVLRLWPNSPFYARRGARLTVGAVKAGGAPAKTSRPNPTTLVVRQPLAAGQRETLSMPWTLRLPRGTGSQLRGGGTSARLASFFPILAWNGAAWATDPAVRSLDSFWPTSPTADFDVRVSAPQGLQVFATGREVEPGHWRAEAVRDFAAAVGSFSVRRSTLRLPEAVRVTVALERDSKSSIGVFRSATVRSLRWYAARYGAYPWPAHTVVAMSDATVVAFAYPTLTFLSDSSIGVVLIPHETGHHWFYSLAGNNQARDPWLSEGLATWAQTGPEDSLAAMRGTSIPSDVRNRIGEPMSFWDSKSFEKFRRGVYVQTVQALAALGDPADVDCALRSFLTKNAYGTTVPRDLLTALRPFFPDAEAKLSAYGAHF